MPYGAKTKETGMDSVIDQVTVTSPDISCGHCVATVQQAVGALEGVRRVEASADTKQVAIEFDSSRVTVTRIEQALDEAGYPVQK